MIVIGSKMNKNPIYNVFPVSIKRVIGRNRGLRVFNTPKPLFLILIMYVTTVFQYSY